MSAPAATTPTAAKSIPRDFAGGVGGGGRGGVWVFLEGFDIGNAFYRGLRATLEFSRPGGRPLLCLLVYPEAPTGFGGAYAFVNPVIPVILGVVLLKDPLRLPMAVAGGIVLAGGALVRRD